MIEGVGKVVIKAEPQTVLEFVLDLERYRQVDTKIGKIKSVERDGNTYTARFGGKLRGIPGPALTYTITLMPWTRLDVAGRNAWLLDFQGSFACAPTGDGVEVEHVERFAFKPPAKWLIEPWARDWLRKDTQAEMERMKAAIEGS